jgi:hypothetical protein
MVGKLKLIIWLVNQARGMRQRIEKPDREYEPVSDVKIPNTISYPHGSTHVTHLFTSVVYKVTLKLCNANYETYIDQISCIDKM